MALKDTVRRMQSMLEQISKDLIKASEKGNKTASQRVRTNTIAFAKLSKQYRKESMESERGGSKKKKATKKKATRKKTTARKKKATKKRRSH